MAKANKVYYWTNITNSIDSLEYRESGEVCLKRPYISEWLNIKYSENVLRQYNSMYFS